MPTQSPTAMLRTAAGEALKRGQRLIADVMLDAFGVALRCFLADTQRLEKCHHGLMPAPNCLAVMISDTLALRDDHDLRDLDALGGRQRLLGGGALRRINGGDGACGEGEDEDQFALGHGRLPCVEWNAL